MDRQIKFRIWDREEVIKTMRTGSKGWYKENGYILQKTLNHPNANKRGYVMEHRLIMENNLRRYLIPKKELVHHVNEVRDDNRIENLRLTNPKDHAIGHIGERNQNGRFICNSPEFEKKKFRLYDSDRRLAQIYTLSELISKTYRRGKFEYRGEWTGLKDKNGNDIYEGELILWDTDLRFIIVFDNGHFYGKPHPDNHIPGTLHFHHFSKSEIIGNIHENPELLNK